MSLSRLMGDVFRLVTQFLHVFAAILWIGGGFYTLKYANGELQQLQQSQEAKEKWPVMTLPAIGGERTAID